MKTLGAHHVSRAYALAQRLHAGQVDRAGKPYIEHIRRVWKAVCGDEVTQVAALLHDAVEDGHIDLGQIEFMFGKEVATVVGLLTRHEGEMYRVYIERLAVDHRARQVKIPDLRDNMDVSRLPEEMQGLWESLVRTRYAPALARLLEIEAKS